MPKLYQDFETRAQIDAEYDVERSVPDFTHYARQYVDGLASVNGVESFWAHLKRAYHGTYHKISKRHIERYVLQFTAKHNMRSSGTLDQMGLTAAGMAGRRLTYAALTAEG